MRICRELPPETAAARGQEGGVYDPRALPSDASSAPGRPAGVTLRQSGTAEPAPHSRIDPIDLLLTLGVAMAVGAAALYRLHPQTIGPGWYMEEGSILAYAERVLEGAVPHRDFLTFYGPGNLWLVAAAFELFGSDIRVERAVGLLYRIVTVVALFGLARRLGGLVAGVLAGLVAAVLLADEVVWAYATYGSLALGIAGLALAASGAALPPGRRRHMVLFGSGIAAGLAALVRFDFVPAIVVSALPLLAFLPTRGRIWSAGRAS